MAEAWSLGSRETVFGVRFRRGLKGVQQSCLEMYGLQSSRVSGLGLSIMCGKRQAFRVNYGYSLLHFRNNDLSIGLVEWLHKYKCVARI